jgi:hypothetical protein
MRIIRIEKSNSATTKNHHLVFMDNVVPSDITVEDAVEDWCENDPFGQTNGYSYKWFDVTDDNEIIRILSNELQNLLINIGHLNAKKNKIADKLDELRGD